MFVFILLQHIFFISLSDLILEFLAIFKQSCNLCLSHSSLSKNIYQFVLSDLEHYSYLSYAYESIKFSSIHICYLSYPYF